MMKNQLFPILVVALCCYLTESNKYYDVIMRAKKCKILNSNYVANFTCRNRRVNVTLSLDSFDITFQPGIALNNFHHSATMQKIFGTIYRSFMVKTDDDLCDIISGNKINALNELVKQDFAKYGNLMDPCPIVGRRYFKDCPHDFRSFPEILPSGDFRLDIIAYTYNSNNTKILLYSINNFIEITTKTALQWK